jgi:hypothetical protein
MHPYEWGILGVKALDFYPIFDCADCTNIAPAVVAVFVEAIARGELTSADVVAIIGKVEFAEFDRLVGQTRDR